MPSVVRVGCDVADVHRRYAAIHAELFGAAAFRLVIAAITGRTARTYTRHVQTLQQLQVQLSQLAAGVPTAEAGSVAHQAEPLRAALTEYIAALDEAVAGLKGMCSGLLEDEDAYRHIPDGGQSAFNLDKVRYDAALIKLEKLGRRLNQLFERF